MISLKNLPKIGIGIIKAKRGYKVPLKVTQYLCYRCNFQCIFCGRRLNKAKELTTEEIKRCMQEFKDLGTQFWGFNGGEPLLREDIGELVRYAKNEMGFKCNLMTNGWFVPTKIKDLKGIDLVSISLDGPRHIHDSIRIKGSYDKVIESLELLKKNKIKTMIITVINNKNIKHLEHISGIVERIGCEWELQPVICHRDDKDKNASKYFPTREELKKVIQWLIQRKKIGKRITNSKEYLQQILINDHSRLPNCWAGSVAFTLSPDGKILPCAEFLAESHKFASFQEMGVKKAILAIPNMSKCRACSFSCYMEYNLALKSLPKTTMRYLKNFLIGRWFWQ